MFDSAGRRFKDLILAPIADRVPATISATAITAMSVVLGITAALAAARGSWTVALILFAANRILDGLDGLVARRRGTTSDLGGYLDILADFLVYAAIPIGVWIGAGVPAGGHVSPLVILLAVFYLNVASWMYLAAVIEKRGTAAGAGPGSDEDRITSVVMPRGVIEGTETIIFYVLFLLFPRYAGALFLAMAVLTAIGIVQRAVWAVRMLR